MGRSRSFTEGAVLDAAAEVFAAGGYEGTSVDDLVQALNLHRGSLYKAFGSKRGLFLAALRHHVDGQLTATVEHADADLVDLLTRTPTLDLVITAATERGPQDSEVATVVRQAVALVDQALGHDLRGDRPGAVELLGIRLYARLHGQPAQLDATKERTDGNDQHRRRRPHR
jgi:TetR/AcrR family transcriptional repressor of nem operon